MKAPGGIRDVCLEDSIADRAQCFSLRGKAALRRGTGLFLALLILPDRPADSGQRRLELGTLKPSGQWLVWQSDPVELNGDQHLIRFEASGHVQASRGSRQLYVLFDELRCLPIDRSNDRPARRRSSPAKQGQN